MKQMSSTMTKFVTSVTKTTRFSSVFCTREIKERWITVRIPCGKTESLCELCLKIEQFLALNVKIVTYNVPRLFKFAKFISVFDFLSKTKLANECHTATEVKGILVQSVFVQPVLSSRMW